MPPNPARRSRSRRAARPPEPLQPPWYDDLIASTLRSPLLGQQRAIFTNRTLRFEKIQAVGFDFDHTLAVYRSAALDRLALELVSERLIRHAGMDRAFLADLPEPCFARKGLVIDLQEGTILKTDRYGHVKRAYHGTRLLDPDEKRQLYGRMDVIPHVTRGKRFIQSDSAFTHPEVLLFAALAPRVGADGCAELWKTIRHHVDTIHRDNSLKRIITARPLDYLTPDPGTVALLRHLRAGGKKVFLLTNSEWEYTRAMAAPALGLGPGPHEGLDWLDLFDLVVVEARKPLYFNPQRAPPRREVLPPKVIAGGDITCIEQLLGVSGPEILYVGDHIYADLITSKRTQSWRTMLVIGELEQELGVMSILPGMADQLHTIDQHRSAAERIVQHWKAVEAALDRIPAQENGGQIHEYKEQCARQREQAVQTLQLYIHKREELRATLSQATNKYWGSLFRANSELTYYGRQLEDFACIYTSRATNLDLYPPDHYFRSAMDYLPHELESMG